MTENTHYPNIETDEEHGRFDKLLYYNTLFELGDITVRKFSKLAKDLFPLLDIGEDADTTFDRVLTMSFLEEYSYNRSLGMPLVEVALACEQPASLLAAMREGYRISLSALVKLAKAEMYGEAGLKAKHISNIESTEGINASIKFLEKAFPRQYGAKSELMIDTGIQKKPVWNIEVTHVGKGDDESDNNE